MTERMTLASTMPAPRFKIEKKHRTWHITEYETDGTCVSWRTADHNPYKLNLPWLPTWIRALLASNRYWWAPCVVCYRYYSGNEVLGDDPRSTMEIYGKTDVHYFVCPWCTVEDRAKDYVWFDRVRVAALKGSPFFDQLQQAEEEHEQMLTNVAKTLGVSRDFLDNYKSLLTNLVGVER